MYICLCKGITEKQFDTMIDEHQGCPLFVAGSMGFDEGCCGRCEEQLPDLIASRLCACSFLSTS